MKRFYLPRLVSFEVLFAVPLRGKALLADGARERALSGMVSEVDHQVGFPLIRLGAAVDRALVLGRLDVRLDVLPEVPGSLEGARAALGRTDEALRLVLVHVQVLLQVRLEFE